MPIETQMYNNLQPIKIATPFENAAMAAQIQQGQNQNRLAQRQFQEADRADMERNALADLYRNSVGADGSIDYRKVTSGLAAGGYGDKVAGIVKQQNEAAASGVELNNKTLTGQKLQGDITHEQKTRAIAKIGAFIQDPNLSADMLLADLQNQVQIGELKFEQAQGLAQQIQGKTPEQLRPLLTNMLNGMLTPQQQMTQGNSDRSYGMDVAKFDYQKDHDAATLAQQRENSIRVDTRARDLNAVKADENAVKREAAANTANMTKQSQLASFDTMIGTLNRLRTHKGLANATGMMNYLPDRKGSDVSNFKAELESFKSQAFIPMVSQLKGMGALSDAEGKKLTAAVGALDTDVMSEAAVRESISRIIADMKAAKARVQGVQEPARTPAKLTEATDYLNGAKNQSDFAKRVKALKAKGWSDDLIRQAYGQ